MEVLEAAGVDLVLVDEAFFCDLNIAQSEKNEGRWLASTYGADGLLDICPIFGRGWTHHVVYDGRRLRHG